MSSNPRITVVTNNYKGNAFIPGFITSLNSQTFPDIQWVVINATKDDDIRGFLEEKDNFRDKIKVVCVEPKNKDEEISYAQGLAEGCKCAEENEFVVKCDIDDRLAPYALEILYREWVTNPTCFISGWELNTWDLTVPYEDLSKGHLSIPKQITKESDILEGGFKKSCVFGNIVGFHSEVGAMFDGTGIEIYSMELAMLYFIDYPDLNYPIHRVIPEVIGSHAIHSSGLRHGIHNEEAMLSEQAAIVKKFNDMQTV